MAAALQSAQLLMLMQSAEKRFPHAVMPVLMLQMLQGRETQGLMLQRSAMLQKHPAHALMLQPS